MQRVVECESDLVSHHRKKANFFGAIYIRSFTGKGERSDLAVGCGQGERANTADSILLQNPSKFGTPSVDRFKRADQRLLVLIDPPSIGFLHGQLRIFRDRCFCLGVEGMAVKRIPFLVAHGHTDKIKTEDSVQLPEQRAKKILRISIRSYRIRYPDERHE